MNRARAARYFLIGLSFVPATSLAGEPISEGIAAVTAAATARTGVDAARVKRGAFIVQVGGCNDCHTPWKMGERGPEPDMTRMLSGHPQDMVMPAAPVLPPGPWVGTMAGSMTAWAGPWGVSFTRNLTSDPETGLGKWTEKEFIDTFRSGRKQGRGREILPPMPWPPLSTLPDEDLKALWAFLQFVPPIVNKVPDPLPPLPPVAPPAPAK